MSEFAEQFTTMITGHEDSGKPDTKKGGSYTRPVSVKHSEALTEEFRRQIRENLLYGGPVGPIHFRCRCLTKGKS